VANALWPEKTTLKSLDLLGSDLEAYYLHSSWGKGPLDPRLFNSAVSTAPSSYLAHDLKGWVLYKIKSYKSAEKSFRSAIKINPSGLGAISGLMWCAVYTNDEEKAYKWAMAKADIRGESREAAKAKVAKRMKKAIIIRQSLP
jgi:tetratricopeptide (TPR) repeat protein